MNVIVFRVILLGVGHKNFVVEIPDAERRVTSRKVRIDETVGSNLVKIFIEGIDLARMKICRIQEIVTGSDTERCAFINGGLTPRFVPLSTAMIACVPSSVGFQPEMEPSSLTKMNRAGAEVPFFVTGKDERGVDDLSGGIPCSSVPRGRWNLYYQRNGCAILMVESGNTGAIVADPNDACHPTRLTCPRD